MVALLSTMLGACNGAGTTNEGGAESESAIVTSVSINGDPANYIFSVTIESPDTGCQQYADWWEVLRPDGSLVYRRILAHSHVDEQPFTRSGGPVGVAANEEIVVRAHLNNSGYGEQVFRGNIEQGLKMDTLDSLFSVELESTDPLPETCAF